jgi:alpha-galactosidase
MGKIPTQLAALMQTNINVQALTVEAVLKEDPSPIYHAAMLDPHTAAELDLDQIWGLVDDLIAAHGEWIPKALRPTRSGYRFLRETTNGCELNRTENPSISVNERRGG